MHVTRRGLQVDEEGRIAEDLFCGDCDYNLRGLPRRGKCPECGERIPRRIRRNLLRYSDPVWLATLLTGLDGMVRGFAALLLTGPVVGLVLVAGLLLSSVTSSDLSWWVMIPVFLLLLGGALGGGILILVGAVRFFRRDPAARSLRKRPRRLVAAGCAVTGLALAGVAYRGNLVVAIQGAYALLLILLLARVHYLATRFPSAGIQFWSEVEIGGFVLYLGVAGMLWLTGDEQPFGPRNEFEAGRMAWAGGLLFLVTCGLVDATRRGLRRVVPLAEEHARTAAMMAGHSTEQA